MALDIFATAGAEVYIGPAMTRKNTDWVQGDFETSPAISWTPISMVESIGSFGDSAQVVSFQAVDLEREIKLKGTRNAGNMVVVCGIKEDDAGQIAMIAAEKTEYNYGFKVVFPNMPTGGVSGGIRYFIGMVMTIPEELAGANNVAKLSLSVEVNSNIVAVAAN